MKNVNEKGYSIAAIGIFALLFFSYMYEPPLIKIEKVTSKELNKKVKIEGEIIKIKEYTTNTQEKQTVLTLKDNTGSIEIVIFDQTAITSTTKIITVIGKVSQYKKKLQIIPEKIIQR